MRQLRKIREAQGLTLRALSEKSGVAYSTIGNYETETTAMSGESLKKIADVLGKTISEISARVIEGVIEEEPLKYVTRSPVGAYEEKLLRLAGPWVLQHADANVLRQFADSIMKSSDIPVDERLTIAAMIQRLIYAREVRPQSQFQNQ